ncbi:MAG: hypothetical protein ACLFUU_13900 [Desulfobacteraceae bacterium]
MSRTRIEPMIEVLFNPVMLDEADDLARDILAQDAVVYLIINNRAGGNAPMLAQSVAE